MNLYQQIVGQIRGLQRKQAVKHAYQRLFTSPDGQIVLVDLIKQYCITPKYVQDVEASRTMEGKRLLVLQLAHTVFEPDQFAAEIVRLSKEAEEEKQNPST